MLLVVLFLGKKYLDIETIEIEDGDSGSKRTVPVVTGTPGLDFKLYLNDFKKIMM